MIIREATVEDIDQIQLVRNSVKENTLSDPSLVTDDDCVEFISVRGKGWVCEADDRIVGFAIVDLRDKNIWALFVRPELERRGIGRRLHNIMLHTYFQYSNDNVWLGTSPGTRAEAVYRKAGWKEIGTHGNNEIKFEMTYSDWVQTAHSS